MSSRLYDDEKMKTLILYLLNELDDEYEFSTLSEIIAWDGSINYFVFNDCFHKLVESGAVSERKVDEDTSFYRISEKGRQTLEMVEENILRFVKEKVMHSATRLLAFKKTGSNITTKITESGKMFKLTCNIENKTGKIFELNLLLDSMEEAEKMAKGFDERTDNIYGGVLALLMGDFRYLREKGM